MSKNIGKFVIAAIVYVGFAGYLYQPYFKNFNRLDYLLVLNVSLAALGCYVLSRRWISLFAGSFLAILLFFQVSAKLGLFTIPIQTRLNLADIGSLFVPFVAVKRNLTLVGFYHIPITSLIMGIFILLAARRFGVMITFCLGVILAFCNPLFNVSPIIWLAIPGLCCCVLIGTGIQGLVSAGSTDRNWILATATIMVTLSIAILLLATNYAGTFAGLGSEYAKLFAEAAKMYILGAVAVSILFFMVRVKLQFHWLRLTILCAAMGVDIFLGARYIVDNIF